jgi:hypothetical protein
MINKKTKHWLHLGWLLILWIHTLRWISCLYHYLLLGHVFRKVNELQWSMLQCSEICLLLLITCVWMDSTYRVAYLVWRILIEWGISCLPKYLCLWEKLWFSMFLTLNQLPSFLVVSGNTSSNSSEVLDYIHIV